MEAPDGVEEILAKYKVEAVTELTEKQYEEIMEELKS